MMERGHVLNGKDSIIGEIGHAVISDSADTTCACGKSGCLESMVSLKKIQQMLNEGCDHADEKVTFQSLFDASAQGDERARKVVRYLAHCFATVLHNLSLTYNQDAVVFQGDFALADVFFDECLKKKLAEFRYFPDGKFFSIDYDRRELSQLAARGDAALMQRMYFSSVL